MVDPDQLEAHDLLLWMCGSHRAAPLAHTNQSTVLRRSRIVLTTFRVQITRNPAGWRDSGDLGLLRMERTVHQRHRFLGGRRLRLHAPYWSLRLLGGALPEGWMANPVCPEQVCENPLDLLRERVIDACLLTPTQMPSRDPDLEAFEIYRSTIELTLLSEEGAEVGPGATRTGPEGDWQLRLFRFLPRSCRIVSESWFEALTAHPDAPPGSVRQVSFLTPQMRQAGLRQPWRIGEAPVRSYVEQLVVLRENAGEPRFLQLLEHLQRRMAPAPALTAC